MKNRVFIGSSTESIDIAREIQEHFDYDKDIEVVLWNQDVFKLTSNALDDLLSELTTTDFAILIFQPNDRAEIRGRSYEVVRDNVIFELGLFIGKLGKDKVFFLIPRDISDLHLPTDLLGTTPGTYNSSRSDDRLSAALSPFCNQVRKAIKKGKVKQKNLGVAAIDLFEHFFPVFEKMFVSSKDVVVYVIHGRSWREHYHSLLKEFLSNKKNHLTVILPNILNENLLKTFEENFDDGKYIPTMIKEAYDFFLALKSQFSNVAIKVSDFYPSYSFYKFDESAFIAMYPTTPKKKNVPTFFINSTANFWNFFYDDFQNLNGTSIELTKKHLQFLKK